MSDLVRANHVVHLDRWWNPATEEQASDRAWRIGQTREVTVHNVVCAETLEERIDQMLDAKRATSDAVLDSGAVTAAVTEMSNEELAEFVRYARSV